MKTVTVTLSANDDASVAGQTITLFNVVTGEEVTKEYDPAGISFEVFGEMLYRLSINDMEAYITPEPVEICITDGEALSVDLVYRTQMLNYYTWEEIAAIAESGEASHIFKIGDTKDFTLTTGENLKAVILDFNHDTLASDTENTAGITFCMLNCLADEYRMNSSFDINSGGYDGSEMFSTVTTEFFDKLPEDMKPYIKRVRKKASAGDKSSTIKSFDVFAFLLAEVEVFGIAYHSFDGEGILYPYFATELNRIKNIGQSEVGYWWLRSPYKYNNNAFCDVGFDGKNGTQLARAQRGLLAGFCM